MKNRNITFTIVLALASFALSPIMQAVSPAPDGGYPGFNTAEGQNALKNLTTGQGNTAIGWFSLFSATTDSFNTGVGAGTLALNTGEQNTATGVAALLLNTTGSFNTANGALALLNNTTGLDNTATGDHALLNNTGGDFNTANGTQALNSNTTGSSNTATGSAALFFNTTASNNTATGFEALFSNTTGADNTATGFRALESSTGSGNTALGNEAGVNVTTASNVIAIGTSGANLSDSCFIGNIWNQTGGSQAVYVNADGKLGAQVSSRRFKEEIKPMERASEAVFALNPVTFRYKKAIDPQKSLQFGLVAEQVGAVDPDLVVRDKEGKPYSVRYDQVNAMLLNEFLKEHRKVQEQEASIAQMKKGMDALVAHIKEQDSKIQKVSDRVEMSKVAAQVATIK